MAELTIEGLDAVQKLLDGLSKGPGLDKALQKAAMGIALEAKRKIASYPGPANSPVIWKTEKSRRWYFWMRRKKGLPLEYTRMSDPMSGKLRESWVAVPWGDAGALVGTKVSYAPYVVGEKDQQPQHYATGWKTEYDAIEDLKSRNVVERVVVAELDSYIKSLKP